MAKEKAPQICDAFLRIEIKWTYWMISFVLDFFPSDCCVMI